MKQKFFRKLVLNFLIAILLAPLLLAATPNAQAADIFIIPKGHFIPFGGNLVEKQLNFCLKRLPVFPWIIAIPFRIFLVYEPSPAGLYWLYGISQLYEEYEFEKSANTLGSYVLGADEAWRKFCDINGEILPKSISGTTWTGLPFERPVTGVAWKMGTSCRVDPQYITDDCHEKVAKRAALQMAEFYALQALAISSFNSMQARDQLEFKKGNTDFNNNCDPYSTLVCYPKGTCNAARSQLAGACVDSAGRPITGGSNDPGSFQWQWSGTGSGD